MYSLDEMLLISLGKEKGYQHLDDVQFELCGDPGCKLKRNVLMGKGASVAAGLRNDAYRICSFNPLFGRECKSIGSGLFSKPVEFEGVKTR